MIARIVQWLCGPTAELSKNLDRRLLRRLWTKKMLTKKINAKKNWMIRSKYDNRDFKIVDDGRPRQLNVKRLNEWHVAFTPLRCHRRSSGTLCFLAVSRRGKDGWVQ